jgi:hypothetical protein
MAWTNDVDHVQVVAPNDPIEVDAEHVESRRRAPVTQQTRLDMSARERLLQKRVVEQIDLANRQVIASRRSFCEARPGREDSSRPQRRFQQRVSCW